MFVRSPAPSGTDRTGVFIEEGEMPGGGGRPKPRRTRHRDAATGHHPARRARGTRGFGARPQRPHGPTIGTTQGGHYAVTEITGPVIWARGALGGERATLQSEGAESISEEREVPKTGDGQGSR